MAAEFSNEDEIRQFTYFGPKFSGGSKFKEKSHDVIMALLGSEEQGGGT